MSHTHVIATPYPLQLLAVSTSPAAALDLVSRVFPRSHLLPPSTPEGGVGGVEEDPIVSALAGGAMETAVCCVSVEGRRGAAAAERVLRAMWRAHFRLSWLGMRAVDQASAGLMEGSESLEGREMLCLVVRRQNATQALVSALRGGGGPASGLLGHGVACAPDSAAASAMAYLLTTEGGGHATFASQVSRHGCLR